MSTVTRAPAKVKSSRARKRRPFSCRLRTSFVEINGLIYTVEPSDPGAFGTASYRVAKAEGDGSVYDVIRTHQGLVECDCPDYEARHRGLGLGLCKHGRAMVELGFLEAPSPAPAPLPRPERLALPAPASPASDADGWPAWTDDWHWTPTPGPSTAPRLTMAEWVGRQVEHYAIMGTELGDLVARHLGRLIGEIRVTGATTPGQLVGRMEVIAAGHERVEPSVLS